MIDVGTSNNGSEEREPLTRRLAGMLSELEDAEVALTNEQAELAQRLATVNAELDRVAKVKRTILGEPARAGRPRGSGSTATTYKPSGKTLDNRKAVLAWLADRENGANFTAKDASRATSIPAQGLGPILVGLEKRGLIETTGRNADDRKVYRRTGKPVAEDD